MSRTYMYACPRPRPTKVSIPPSPQPPPSPPHHRLHVGISPCIVHPPMLAAHPSVSCRCWSSILASSFTCTFLLPSFFSSGSTTTSRRSGRSRGVCGSFLVPRTQRGGRRQFSAIATRSLSTNGNVRGRFAAITDVLEYFGTDGEALKNTM